MTKKKKGAPKSKSNEKPVPTAELGKRAKELAQDTGHAANMIVRDAAHDVSKKASSVVHKIAHDAKRIAADIEKKSDTKSDKTSDKTSFAN